MKATKRPSAEIDELAAGAGLNRLAAAGNYDASLMITDVTGNDTFDFTLAVAEVSGPTIYNVDPSIGVLGETVTFTVDYTSYGTPSFSWPGRDRPRLRPAIRPASRAWKSTDWLAGFWRSRVGD